MTRGRPIHTFRQALALVAVVLFVLVTTAGAQERVASQYDGQTVQRARPTTMTATPTSVNLQRLGLAMGLVLGLIVVLRYAAGWLFPGTRAGGTHRGVRVLARTAIAPRQQVLLLHVGRRILVVGDSAGTLSRLADIAEPDEVAELLGQTADGESQPVTTRFKSMFGTAKHQYDTPAFAPHDDDTAEPAGDPQVAAAQEEISGLLDRMRSLTRSVRR